MREIGLKDSPAVPVCDASEKVHHSPVHAQDSLSPCQPLFICALGLPQPHSSLEDQFERLLRELVQSKDLES